MSGPISPTKSFTTPASPWRDGRFSDEGHAIVSSKDADRGAFKTPTLREVARTSPYMHDGSVATLKEVVDFYDRGGQPNPYVDSEMRPRQFTADETMALIAFLRALSGQIHEGWR